MPVEPKCITRHRDMKTTLAYYVDQTAEDVAAGLCAAYQKENGNISGNIEQRSIVVASN